MSDATKDITPDIVIRAKKTLKELTPEQLIALKSCKGLEDSTKQLIISEYNKRLVGGQ